MKDHGTNSMYVLCDSLCIMPMTRGKPYSHKVNVKLIVNVDGCAVPTYMGYMQ